MSAVCLVLNFLIGETIFANIILLFVAFITAANVFLGALIAFFKADKGSRPVGAMIGAAIIIGVIVILVATDNVAGGYGP